VAEMELVGGVEGWLGGRQLNIGSGLCIMHSCQCYEWQKEKMESESWENQMGQQTVQPFCKYGTISKQHRQISGSGSELLTMQRVEAVC